MHGKCNGLGPESKKSTEKGSTIAIHPLGTLAPVSVEFARSAVAGLARIEPQDLAPGNLTLPLELSRWMHEARLDEREAIVVLLDLRRALLKAGGLDVSTEPVPLLAGDSRHALVALATYLEGLVRRASFVAGPDIEVLVGAAFGP